MYNKRECYIRLSRIYIPTINFLKFFVTWEMGGSRPFFVSEFTLVLKLFEHNFVDFYLIWQVGGKVGGPRPFLVSEFISIPELYVQNFVVVRAFIEEISAEKYLTDTLCFLFINRFCPFSIPNKPYIRQISVPNFVRRTDGRTQLDRFRI